MNSGSFESWKVSALRCSYNAKARQMRLTALWLSPQRRAIERVDQCVASRGCVFSVRVSTRSTVASLIWRGAPGRGSSSEPTSEKPAAPLAQGLLREMKMAGHGGVALALRTRQHHTAAQCQGLGGSVPAAPAFQGLLLVRVQGQRRNGACGEEC
jgi:hypothetical protein